MAAGLPHPSTSRTRTLLLSICLFAVAKIQAVAAPVPEYHTRVWTTDDGLPHNNVSKVLQDSTGFMWFATTGGLARFDGHDFREVRQPAEHLSGYNIRGLAEEPGKGLLVVSTGGALLRLRHETWSVHPATAVITALNQAPMDVYVDSVGVTWIVTSTGRIVRWNPDDSHKFVGPEAGFVSGTKSVSFASNPDGGVWICGDELWFADRTGELTRVIGQPVNLLAIGAGREGRSWLWMDRQLVQLERGKVMNRFPAPSSGQLGRVRDLYEDSRGSVWISTTRGGLLRFDGDEMTRVSTFSVVLNVTEDREGNIWVGTGANGAAQLREKSYHLFNTANGLSQDAASSLDEDSTGHVWIANRNGGLISIGADGVRPSGLSGSRMFSTVVCVDAEDRMYFGGGRNGLSRWRPGDVAPERLSAPATDPHALFRARNGDVWFASASHEVGYYRGNELRVFKSSDGFPDREIRTITEDRVGNIWLGGRSGELLRWDGHTFEHFDLALTDRAPVHTIHADEGNHLWIGTANGLVLKDGSRLTRFTAENGLADDIIQAIVEDAQGFLWFASRRGIFYVAKSDLLSAARDPQFKVESHRLGPNQGLVGITATSDFSPMAIRARDGSLWFATQQGAVKVDPARLPRDLPPPPVLVDEVRVDGHVVADDGGLRIPSGQHRIEFRFAALSYTTPENVILRHQLEGADPQWIEAGTDRVASYTRLPPGNYRLHVIARNSTGQWNSVGATFAFSVVPAWWETLVFRVGCLVALLVIVAWIARVIAHRRVRLRVEELERQHALEKERIRIARDLHDDLGAGLTEVTMVASRIADAAPKEFGPQVSGLAWRTRRLATELSGIIWTMNADHTSLEHLAKFLRRYAERLFRDTGITCVVNGVEKIPDLPMAPAVQHQVLSVAKEALNNIMKHARATETHLELGFANHEFTLEIRDNGTGFAPESGRASGGNGLRNMQSRAEEIGGALDVVSTAGAGTRITLRVPCAARDLKS